MKMLNNKFILFLFKFFFPTKYNIEKFAMVGSNDLIDKENKNKWNNIKTSLTFYLKKKKTGRVIVVKGNFEDLKKQYGEEYEFMEPMIKNVNDEWDESGRLIKR